ncbi:hypothetical protein ILYODFUR_027684, partial [Ilyodon furcidens]
MRTRRSNATPQTLQPPEKQPPGSGSKKGRSAGVWRQNSSDPVIKRVRSTQPHTHRRKRGSNTVVFTTRKSKQHASRLAICHSFAPKSHRMRATQWEQEQDMHVPNRMGQPLLYRAHLCQPEVLLPELICIEIN